jgi:hypothetical protein
MIIIIGHNNKIFARWNNIILVIELSRSFNLIPIL